jgi:hypothetical protein
MHHLIRRFVGPFLLSVLALSGAPAVATDPSKAAGESGFSGRWALSETRDDVVLKGTSSGWSGVSGAGEAPGSVGGRNAGGGFDLPLEVMTDARRLVIVDDGTTLRVTYPTGRKRTFVTDGEKRYLDDGDGPADVTAERKGATVTVVSEWFRGYKLRETWELRENPRRLDVTGKVRGRESQKYVRAYEPAPPAETSLPEAVATPAPQSTPGPDGTPPPPSAAGSTSEPTPPAVDRMSECSIRPPRNARQEELRRLARITQEEAGRKAVASLAPLQAYDVISSDVEDFEGCLAWPFTLRLSGKKGVQEVFVDAGDGKVVSSEFVPMGPPAGATPAP